MRISTTALLLVLVVGCGKSKPPTLSVNLPAPTGQALTPVAGPLTGGPGQDPTRTPAQWGELLTTGDPRSIQLAGTALGNLGKEGFPYLLQGMQSNSWEVALTSLRAAPREDVIANRGKTLPVLQSLAGDTNPQIAQYAIIRLGWFGPEGRSAMPVLLQKLQDTSDVTSRDEIVQTIVSVHDTVPLLADLVRHANPLLRKAAAVRLLGLAKNGTRIDAAGTVLAERANNDSDPEVRSLAGAALQTITGKPTR